jgi:hypothetical protein
MKLAAVAFLTAVFAYVPSSVVVAVDDSFQDPFSGSLVKESDILTPVDDNGVHTFTWGFKAMLTGVDGDASDSASIGIFQDKFVEAWNEVNADGDVHAVSIHVDSASPGFIESSSSLRTGTTGTYTYNGSGRYDCNRCSPGFVSFSGPKDVFKVLTGSDFEMLFTSKLATSGGSAFASVTNINIVFIPNAAHGSVVAADTPVVVENNEKQTFEWGFTAMLNGVDGDASTSSSVGIFQEKFVEAWNEANADGDVHAMSIHVDSVTPGFVESSSSLRTGTTGTYTYNGSGRYDCNRCSPGVVSFVASSDGLLKALIGNKDFETLLTDKLVASSELTFASLSKVNVAFVPIHASSESTALAVADNGAHQFTWGYKAMLKNVVGDGETSDCITAFCASFVAAWNDANVDGDVHAVSCSVTSATPGFVALGTSGTYTYNGSGRYDCNRCSPGFLSFSSTEDVVKAVTGSDFETNFASNLSASSCSAFSAVDSVQVVFIPNPQGTAAELDTKAE